MSKFLNIFSQLFFRFRYPFSTPEEIASDIGLNLTNHCSFEELISSLTNPSHRPSKISKFMPRNRAENLFQAALRSERFSCNTLFSYYFKGGWVDFILHFDEQSRLRRLYIFHKDLKQRCEISISQ